MSIEEARGRISEIISVVNGFASAVGSFENQLSSISGEVGGIDSSFTENVDSDVLIRYSSKKKNEITSNIDSCISQASSALSTLRSDANKKIRDIVNAYNSSLDKDHIGDRLPYIEI